MAGDDSELVRVRYEQFERELVLCNVAYEWQEEQLLRDLFGPDPIAAQLQLVVGFCVDDPLVLADVITHWGVDALMNGALETRQEVEAFRGLIAAQRAGHRPSDPSDAQAVTIAELAEPTNDQLDEMSQAFVAFSVWNRLGDRSSFTLNEVADAANVPLEGARRFLELFSQPFGHVAFGDPDALVALSAGSADHA